jgi:hypothetical protein
MKYTIIAKLVNRNFKGFGGWLRPDDLKCYDNETLRKYWVAPLREIQKQGYENWVTEGR